MGTENASHEFPGEYRLDAEDFGPIVRASVDLRPLTVFIGPSNTGKSYLATLIHALHQCFHVEEHDSLKRNYSYIYDLLDSVVESLMREDSHEQAMLDDFKDWMLSTSDDIYTNNNTGVRSTSPAMRRTESDDLYPSASRVSLPRSVESYIRSVFESSRGHDSHSERRIGRCFGVDSVSQLVRRLGNSGSSRIRCSIPRTNELGMFRYQVNLQGDGSELSFGFDRYESLSDDIRLLGSLDVGQANRMVIAPWKRLESEDVVFFLTQLIEDLFMWFLRPLHRNSYYLPASRTGLIHSHRVVSSSLVEGATIGGYRGRGTSPTLSGVLGDFLNQLGEMSARDRESSTLGSRHKEAGTEANAGSLERAVLKGAVELHDVGSGSARFDFRPNGWSDTLPLIHASSMISELAPVVLYLRYVVRHGDVLIIEEPESHLHPAMQVEFTRQLAGLVRAGIRVIVTTHSEWVLQELANLVRVSKLHEGERAGIAGGDVALDASQVGAWFFKPDPNGEGSTVSEIGLDEESGLYPTDFEEVARAMHNDWAEIFSRLGEAE